MSDFWAVNVDGAYWTYNNISLPVNFQATQGQVAIFDTAHDFICAPTAIKTAFENTFSKNCTAAGTTSPFYYNKCKDTLPTFAIVLGKYAYYFDSGKITTFADTNLKIYLADECVIGTKNSWVLGMPFFQQFSQIVLDDTNNVAGIYTTKNRVNYGGVTSSKMLIIIGIIIAVIVLIGLGLGIYCWMKRRNSEEGLSEGLTK